MKKPNVCVLTFELLKHMLSLLMAAELNETLQHSNGVVSKRHLEAREQSEPTVHKISEHKVKIQDGSPFFSGDLSPQSNITTM